ncbi:MAG TPA: VOC family protein, partial [Bryobacteraceae bacterium]
PIRGAADPWSQCGANPDGATTLFYRGWRHVMPTAKDGKICYIEMPTKHVQASADFYQRAFGWTIRTRGDGAIAFDDTTGEVSGAFVLGRPPSSAPGLMVYIMVDSVAEAMKKVEANGGEIVQPIGGDPGEITARFRDPGGNVIGLYQEPA